jgi:hypothetical protein
MPERPDDTIELFSGLCEACDELDSVLDRRERHLIRRGHARGRELLFDGYARIVAQRHPSCVHCALLAEEAALLLWVNGPPLTGTTVLDAAHRARVELVERPPAGRSELTCLLSDLPQ